MEILGNVWKVGLGGERRGREAKHIGNLAILQEIWKSLERFGNFGNPYGNLEILGNVASGGRGRGAGGHTYWELGNPPGILEILGIFGNP